MLRNNFRRRDDRLTGCKALGPGGKMAPYLTEPVPPPQMEATPSQPVNGHKLMCGEPGKSPKLESFK